MVCMMCRAPVLAGGAALCIWYLAIGLQLLALGHWLLLSLLVPKQSQYNLREQRSVTRSELFLFSVSPCLRSEQVLRTRSQSLPPTYRGRAYALRFRKRDEQSLLPEGAR